MERTLPRRKVLMMLATAGLTGIRVAAAAECRIVVLGDSLGAGYGLSLAEAFPARLEGALRRRGLPCTVLDAGVSGDTSAGGAARIEWVLADRPSHLLVELGGNDALRALPPERQQLLVLKFVEHLSNAEIGAIMNRTEGAIKSLYHRTLLALRGKLEDRGDESRS